MDPGRRVVSSDEHYVWVTHQLFPGGHFSFASFRKTDAAPLYYAALCGFHAVAEHLIDKFSPHKLVGRLAPFVAY
jgi:hypothetical protein